MRQSPRQHHHTICCGSIAIGFIAFALTCPASAGAQQVNANPLRQATGRSDLRQASQPAPRTTKPATEIATQPQPEKSSELASEPATAPAKESPVRQASFVTQTETVPADDHIHFASQGESVLLHEPHDGFIVDEGIPQKGVFQKGGIIQKGDIFQKGGIAQKGDCDSCGGGGCMECCLIPCLPFSLDNLEFFGGAQGFSGPANRGGTGSFGFHQGFNIGMPMPCFNGCFGVQLGLRTTQSNLSGAGFPADAAGNMLFTDEIRNQTFLTAGLFRRVDWGLQGGIAIDYLADSWYSEVSINQLRGEASWVFPCAHELGFMFSSATDEDQQISVFTGGGPLTEIWEATNQYAFFYRHRPAYLEGAEARVFAGWSGDHDGIIGVDMRLPLHDSLALEMGASYLIPEQANTGLPGGGHEEESWNMAVSLVWYPGCRSAYGGDYFRPLLNVADNGSFRFGRR